MTTGHPSCQSLQVYGGEATSFTWLLLFLLSFSLIKALIGLILSDCSLADEASLRPVMYGGLRRVQRRCWGGSEGDRETLEMTERERGSVGRRVKAAALIHLKSAVIYHSDNTHWPPVCVSMCVCVYVLCSSVFTVIIGWMAFSALFLSLVTTDTHTHGDRVCVH